MAVSRILCGVAVTHRAVVAIHLGRPLPDASCGLPEGSSRLPSNATEVALRLRLTLLRVGFTDNDVSAAARALLPHVFTLAPRVRRPGARFAFCGTFPGVAPAGR